MNLNQIVSGCVASVNPMIAITVQVSTGSVIDANYNQVPTYSTLRTMGQVQSLSANDLRQTAGLNLTGITQAVYLNGNFEGVFRVLGKGGDLLMFNGHTYLVTAVLERWSDWTKVAVTMQMDS